MSEDVGAYLGLLVRVSYSVEGLRQNPRFREAYHSTRAFFDRNDDAFKTERRIALPFNTLMRIHDHIWRDRSEPLDHRAEISNQLLVLAYNVARDRWVREGAKLSPKATAALDQVNRDLFGKPNL